MIIDTFSLRQVGAEISSFEILVVLVVFWSCLVVDFTFSNKFFFKFIY